MCEVVLLRSLSRRWQAKRRVRPGGPLRGNAVSPARGFGGWHPGLVGIVIRLIELVIVLVPLVGLIVAGMRAFSAARERQGDASEPAVAGEPPRQPAVINRAAQWRTIARTIKEQDRADTRWLDYELDTAKLLDFPLMTDMRDPLTMKFHRAKLRADLLRPAKVDDLVDDRVAAREYLEAVGDYVSALDVAESEAIRRRRNDFALSDQQRLARAQKLLQVASNTAATPRERERAYGLACNELDGLLVLPERARAAIERGIAGELDG
jgi:hypothetical protein